MKIARLGLVANARKKEIRDVVKDVLELVPRNVAVCGLEETANLAPADAVQRVETLTGCDAVLALGGDGTLLMAARMVAEEEIPLLGIKIRSLGFLAEDDPRRAIGDLFAGRFSIQDRLRLSIVCEGGEGTPRGYSALNDAVVHGVGVSRVLHLETTINGTVLGEYLADGVIVSTPTGSTAYSLAAGGPIVNPTSVEAFVITPLCPHSLSVRPIVVSAGETVSVAIVEDAQETLLTIDGQQSCVVGKGDKLVFRRSSTATKLIVTDGYSFYDIVRRKLKWGGMLRQDH
ncbi:MAG: NAD(+)/NADH kinase [Candidatus Krumholzibacteriia bacterium]